MNFLEPAQFVMAAVDPVFVALFVLLIICVLVYEVFSRRCPRKNHFFALKLTGDESDSDGKFFVTTYQEWSCKYCDHRKWKKDHSEGGPIIWGL